jgi:hypothetical protein
VDEGALVGEDEGSVLGAADGAPEDGGSLLGAASFSNVSLFLVFSLTLYPSFFNLYFNLWYMVLLF